MIRYIAIGALVAGVVGMIIYAFKCVGDIAREEMDEMDEAKHGPFTEDDAVREIPPTPKVAEVVFEG